MTKVRITDRGIIQEDGGSGVSFESGNTSVALAGAINPVNTLLSGGVTASLPGFYYIQGATTTTCSVPPPQTYPGATLIFSENVGSNFCLTGSANGVNKALFASQTAAVKAGTRVNSANSGSVVMVSDGNYWCICGGTGSHTVAGAVF